jgi:hypothetical protein
MDNEVLENVEEAVVDEGLELAAEDSIGEDSTEITEVEPEVEGENLTEKVETPAVMGKTIRDAVRKLSEEHPEQAKLLKQLADEHFNTENTYKKLFATPEEATTAKELIEAVGGVDGVRTLQERIEAYDTQDNMLNTGDPKLLDEIFTQFPDGAAKLAPVYLDKLASSNPQVFNETMAPYVLGLLSQNGVINHVKNMLNEADASRLPNMVTQLATWLDNQIKGVNSLKTASQGGNGKADPLQAERAAIQEERQQIFIGKVESVAMAKIMPVVNSIVSQQTKNFKLSESQVEHYKDTLDKKVWTNLNANPVYNKQLKIRLANKNVTPESIAEYQAAEYNRVFKELAFDTAKSIFGSPKGSPTVTKKTEAIPQVAGKPVILAKAPQDSEIDWTKPNAELMYIKNQGYLKSTGKFVSWK